VSMFWRLLFWRLLKLSELVMSITVSKGNMGI
jgi:hypothetical protein